MEQPRDSTFVTRASLFLRLNQADPQPRELAWEEFSNRYSLVIRGFARKMGAARDELDDIVQDILFGFYSASPEFVYDPAKGRFRGYLKTCVFRSLKRRFAGRKKAINIDNAPENEIAAEQVWDDIWEKEMMRRAIELARAQYKNNDTFQAFVQHVLHDRAAEEVAKELGMSVDSVYKAKQRVQKVITERVQELFKQEG